MIIIDDFISTARCSSSRNSLRGITHSPITHSTFWWRCYLQLWWYFLYLLTCFIYLSSLAWAGWLCCLAGLNFSIKVPRAADLIFKTQSPPDRKKMFDWFKPNQDKFTKKENVFTAKNKIGSIRQFWFWTIWYNVHIKGNVWLAEIQKMDINSQGRQKHLTFRFITTHFFNWIVSIPCSWIEAFQPLCPQHS